MNEKYENPFQITTPEDLTAGETVKLFVDVFNDFDKILDPGHAFLIGPRGSGKSMMLRYMQPDCQCLSRKCRLNELPFLAIYIPLKNTNFILAELQRLEEKHASEVLNENILVLHCTMKVFETLKDPTFCDEIKYQEIKKYYDDIFLYFFGANVNEEELKIKEETSISVIEKIIELLGKEYTYALSYTKKLAFTEMISPYCGLLVDYLTFLFPLLKELSNISSLPNNTIYLLLDDAHMLSLTLTKILNSWISTRTSGKVSLKISTQYNYKTYYTNLASSIDSPHDYSEVDMSTIYTTSYKDKYRSRIIDIIKKRFEFCNIEVSPEDFFPADIAQEKAIADIAIKYKEKFDNGEGRGHNRSDDAIRYSRPDHIKNLSGVSKSSNTYSYSGLDQLIHLSSGIIRYFLEPAHAMFAKQKAKTDATADSVRMIDPSIQNDIMRSSANEFFFNDLDKLKKEGTNDSIPIDDLEKLSNLIEALGGLFRCILLSNRSERRVFSIAISDKPSQEVERILKLGIQFGYFHQSTIGKKNATIGGRTKLYVLNRRLAPIWTLDPTGFAGYLFLQNKWLEIAIDKPSELMKRVLKEERIEKSNSIQMSIFGDDESPILIETLSSEEEQK